MSRISTYALNNATLNAAMNVQSALATADTQEASGLVSETYGGLGGSAGQLISLQDELDQAQSYSANATTAGNRAQAMYSAVGNMITLGTSLRTTLSSAISGIDTTGLTSSAEATLQDLADQLNTQSGGVYLFGGSDTDTAPVDLTNYPATSPPSATTADTSYYQGNDSAASVRVSAQQTITYGVTGDDPAFEQALRAADMVATATTDPVDTTTLEAAYTLAGTALTSLSDLQSAISDSASRLQRVETTQTSFISFTSGLVDDIKNVNTAETSAEVSEYQTQLQASYSAVAAAMKVKLTDYL